VIEVCGLLCRIAGLLAGDDVGVVDRVHFFVPLSCFLDSL
jgi:hypothetical protein